MEENNNSSDIIDVSDTFTDSEYASDVKSEAMIAISDSESNSGIDSSSQNQCSSKDVYPVSKLKRQRSLSVAEREPWSKAYQDAQNKPKYLSFHLGIR